MSDTKTDKKYGKNVALIYDALSIVLEEQVGTEKAKIILNEQLRALAHALGGNNFYMPRMEGLRREIRDNEIYKRFNGHNVDDLTFAFKMCDRNIHQIIAKQRALHIRKIQPDLFN